MLLKKCKTKTRLLGVATLALFLATPLIVAAKEPAAVYAISKSEINRAVKRSEELIAFYLQNVDETTGAPGQYGVAVAVSVCGEIVWNNGFGYADLENRTTVTDKTRFRVGSVSKTLTSAALGQLIDAGKLDLDAVVQIYGE